MIRYFLLMALVFGGLSAYAQQAGTAKPSCNISQCQKATSTSSAMAVSQTATPSPDRATATVTPSCSAKTAALPLNLDVKAISAANCQPENCNPANCQPRSCQDEGTKMSTTLAVKQE